MQLGLGRVNTAWMNRGTPVLSVAVLAVALSACGNKEAAGEPKGPPPSALPVDVIVLEQKPVRDASEYLATLVSRTSVALYPQVVGHISKIVVKPGTRVKAGTELVQIDPRQQQATLDQLVASKKLKEANLRFAEERAARSSMLLENGLLSRQDFEQTLTEKEAAAAGLTAAEAEVQAQASQLRFFKITAPFDGVVGDIPVKLGELVSTTTLVKTVNQNAALEAYVDVPVERAADLTPDSLLQLLDSRGAVTSESPVTFVADQAKADTQSILIKGAFPHAEALKVAQVVRVRVVWSTRPGLKLPTTAVMRQAGQSFSFVAEQESGGVVAKQRAIKLGAIEGNDFVIVDGLKPGERVIVSGIQKLREGAKVEPKG